MKRPMLYILLFFIIGIVCGQYASIALLVFVAIAAAVMLSIAYGRFGFMYLIFVAIVGFMLFGINTAVPNNEIDTFSDTDRNIRVSGVVRDIIATPQNNYGRSCFVFDGKVFDCDGNKIDKSIRIRVYYTGNVSVGDSLVITGRLTNAAQRTNPSELDYGRYMLAKGQRYIFYAQKADFYGNQKSLGTVLSLFRDKMCKNFYSVMPKNEASVMCTMILGDRGGLDDEIGDLYRKTGIYHILAISGLHITLLGTILARLFSFLGKRRAFGITMVVLLLYCIMTGCSATVVRAVIMFYIMAIGSFIYREYDVVSATAFAAMLLLIFNPYYLYDIGFELSFAVVFALGAVTDIAVKYNTQGLNTIGVAVAADLASKPILMFYFYNAGIWSIIANLMLAPIMSCTVALGFICAAVGLVNISLARLVSIPAVYILRTIESWCKVFVSLPCSYIVTGRPHMYALIGYAVLLFVCYRFIMCGKLKPTIASLTAAFIVLLLGTPAVLNKINIINNQSVTFLDDACAVIEDNGSCYIVDMGGGAIPSEYLMYRGIGEADGVFAAYNASDDSISLSEGESVEINTDSRIECVYSDGDFKVLRLACDGKTVLFTGKTDNKTQKLLCKNGYALSADVLQLNSVNEDFVKAVSPEYTVMTEKENMKATGMVTVRLTDKPTVSNYLEDE